MGLLPTIIDTKPDRKDVMGDAEMVGSFYRNTHDAVSWTHLCMVHLPRTADKAFSRLDIHANIPDVYNLYNLFLRWGLHSGQT
jgi:hypothetical protein